MKKFISILFVLMLTVPVLTSPKPQPYKTATYVLKEIPRIRTPLQSGVRKYITSIAPQKTLKISEIPFEIKILVDMAHDQTYNLDQFLSDVSEMFGVNVTINKASPITSTLLSDYDVFILPNPTTPLTSDEISAIKDYIENGGIVFLIGDWYGKPYSTNFTEITGDYGVAWINCSVYDKTNYDYRYYYPLIHTWKNNIVANFLSNDGTFQVKAGGNMMKVIDENDSTKTIYVVGTGDDDTYIKYSNGTIVTTGYDTIVFIAIDLIGKGRMFLSHSPFMRDPYFYSYKYDNKEFALRVIHWLLAEGLEIVNYEIPAEPVLSGEYAYLNVTIRNNAETAATNVHVGIELEGTVELVNESSDVIIGDLEPGAEKTICWVVKSTGTSIVKAKFKVWSDNVFGFSIVGSFKTLGLVVTSSLLYDWTVLTAWDWTILTVNVSNPAETGITARNINVTVNVSVLFGNVTTENESWTYVIPELPSGEFEILTWKLYASDFPFREDVYITVSVESSELGSAKTRVTWMVFTDNFVIFDQGHGQHWNASYGRMGTLFGTLMLYYWFNVYLNNDTFTKDELGNASLVVISCIDEEYLFTSEEIQLLHWYIDNGGKLWIMGNWYKYFTSEIADVYNEITGKYGILWNVGEIEDDKYNLYNYSFLVNITQEGFANNPIANAILFGVGWVFYPGGTYLNVTDPAVPVLCGNNESYGVNATGKPSGINGTNLTAMAAYYDPHTGAKILAIGSSGIFGDDYYPYQTYPVLKNSLLLNKILMWFEYYPDTTPPTVNITSPKSDSWIVSKTITLEWTALDNVYLLYTEIYVNDTLWATVPGFFGSYNLTLDEGHWEIETVAYDWTGLSGSDEITIHIDVTAPKISITYPQFEQEFEMEKTISIEVKWNASDNLILDHFVIYINGTKIGEVNGTTFSYVVTLNETGAYYIKVEAWDKAGNSAYSEVLIYVKPKPVTPIWIYITIGVVVVAVIAVAVFLLKRKGKV